MINVLVQNLGATLPTTSPTTQTRQGIEPCYRPGLHCLTIPSHPPCLPGLVAHFKQFLYIPLPTGLQSCALHRNEMKTNRITVLWKTCIWIERAGTVRNNVRSIQFLPPAICNLYRYITDLLTSILTYLFCFYI